MVSGHCERREPTSMAFWSGRSKASHTIGQPPKSSRTFSEVTMICRVCISSQGLICIRMSCSACVLGMPRWGIIYICRLRLVTSTRSKSTRRRCPTPDLARLTAMLDPRPPSPATATEAFCSFSFIQTGKRSSKARSSSSFVIWGLFFSISGFSAFCIWIIWISPLLQSGGPPRCLRPPEEYCSETRGG